MKNGLLKALLTTDYKKKNARKQRSKAELNAEKEKAQMERRLWELAEEYEEE